MSIYNIYNTFVNHTEKIKWLGIITILLLINSIYYFFLNKFSIISKIIFFSLSFIPIINIFIQTNLGKKTLIFIKDIKLELSNIVWPNYKETVRTTGIVLLLITLTSIFLWILDGLMLHTISWILTPRL